jgi:hypothetical protein
MATEKLTVSNPTDKITSDDKSDKVVTATLMKPTTMEVTPAFSEYMVSLVVRFWINISG